MKNQILYFLKMNKVVTIHIDEHIQFTVAASPEEQPADDNLISVFDVNHNESIYYINLSQVKYIETA